MRKISKHFHEHGTMENLPQGVTAFQMKLFLTLPLNMNIFLIIPLFGSITFHQTLHNAVESL